MWSVAIATPDSVCSCVDVLSWSLGDSGEGSDLRLCDDCLSLPRTPQTAQLVIFVIICTSRGVKPHTLSQSAPTSCDQVQRW